VFSFIFGFNPEDCLAAGAKATLPGAASDAVSVRTDVAKAGAGTPAGIHRPVLDSAWEDAEFRIAAMSLLLKCADINSCGRPPAVAGMWARAIYNEFFRQAELEKSLGLPPTPVFQRENVLISDAQV
jgi:3'5'-cyclic nucleotide phosphodiesterase